MNKPYKLISKNIRPGRNGNQDIIYVIRIDNGKEWRHGRYKFYQIVLHCEYVRINKEGKQENIYRCVVSTSPNGYQIYSGFEHPANSLDYFLKKAKVIP